MPKLFGVHYLTSGKMFKINYVTDYLQQTHVIKQKQ